MLQLTALLERKADRLSVNILQRVAIGRSAIMEPAIFLLDEPLSNVDAAFRAVMRTELKHLQRQFRQTMVYVTHDQEEALTLSDRIAVLDAGTLTLVSGATGSGKSTLLRAIAGLHTHSDGGWITGALRVVGHERDRVPPRDLAQRVGVVLQHPREAFATERVRDEIGLALELRGVAPVIVATRVAEVAARAGVTALLPSEGQGVVFNTPLLIVILIGGTAIVLWRILRSSGPGT